MTNDKKFRVWCNTEGTHVITDWTDTVPTNCPNDPAHIIDPEKTSRIKKKQSYYIDQIDDAETSTTSGSYIQKTRMSLTDIPAGDYRIMWSSTIRASMNGKSVIFRIRVDNTTTIIEENSTSNKYSSFTKFARITLSAGDHTIDVDYKREKPPAECFIKNVRLELRRV